MSYVYTNVEGSRMKTESILVRVAPDEKEAFREAAEIAGLALSAWIRERLRRTAVRELEQSGRPIRFVRQRGSV